MAKTTSLEWKVRQRRLEKAIELAEETLSCVASAIPVDPLLLVESEGRLLKARGRDFREGFDGRLEYHREHGRFLLFYNTKYDAQMVGGGHHPRTRFSIAHELGHYFLPGHRSLLIRGMAAHGSRGEAQVDSVIESEADAFASGLLMPTKAIKSRVNAQELSLRVVQSIAEAFQVSLVSAAIRCVRLSHFPCGVAGIRSDGSAWVFPSAGFLELGCVPLAASRLPSTTARAEFQLFRCGRADGCEREARVSEWFQSNRRDDLADILLTEEYVPIPKMGTLLVLLSASEGDFDGADEDERDEDE